jgi:Uncharacterized protein conserved in bacteria (DUF2188)
MKGRNFIKSLRLFEALKLSLTDRELHQGVVILARGGVTEETMARDQFFVMLHEGRWKIKHNGQHSKPYHSQTAALKDAIDQAHEVHKKGGLSQVLVQREDLQFREERTFGKDPYPPAG